jgi:hypothetical protein
VKLTVTLRNGQTCDVLGIEDVEAWVKSFVGRGTSQLGDWLEVIPVEGTGRTFVRASEVVTVQVVGDE